jgi:hypothetical protein
MGGDPAPGKYKTLVVVYQLDDQPHLQLIKDTGDWQLPETNK